MSVFGKTRFGGAIRIFMLAMIVGAFTGFSAPADAHMRDRSAYSVGTHFPYVSGYRYHPSGFWYSANLSGCRYPARYYRYRHNVGYVYIGPNHRYYRHRNVRRHYVAERTYRPRRHDYYRYHYRAQNRGIFTGGFHHKYRY